MELYLPTAGHFLVWPLSWHTLTYSADQNSVATQDDGVTSDEVKFLYNGLDRLTAWADLLDRKSLQLERELNEANEFVDAARRERDFVKRSKWLGFGRSLPLGPRL